MRVNNEFWILKSIDTFETDIEKTFKKEFSEIELNVLPEKLFRVFQHNSLKNGRSNIREYISNYAAFSEFFGLPYTSSSAYAGLWNTNSEYEILSGIFLQGFTIDDKNHAVAIASDREENYFYYDLGLYYDFQRD